MITQQKQVENKSDIDYTRWLPWRNDSSETCPAGGLVRVTGSIVNGRELVRLGNKPNADSQAGLYVNHFLPVKSGKYGLITRESPCIMAYQTGSPANGQTWGAKNAEWKLHSGYSGWLIDGAAETSLGLVPAQRIEINTPGSWFGHGSATTITSFDISTPTVLTLSQVFDKGGCVSVASNEMTVLIAGDYQVTPSVYYAGGTTGSVEIVNNIILQTWDGAAWITFSALTLGFNWVRPAIAGGAWHDRQTYVVTASIVANTKIRFAGTKNSAAADVDAQASINFLRV